MSNGRRLGFAIGVAALSFFGGGGAEARLRLVPGASPTNGQEVSPDLSDPDVDGVIRIRSRFPPRMVRLLLGGTAEEPLLTLRDHGLSRDFSTSFSVGWEGKIAVIDLEDPEPVVFKIPLPGVRSVFSTTTQ